jgi:hypothetical protein
MLLLACPTFAPTAQVTRDALVHADAQRVKDNLQSYLQRCRGASFCITDSSTFDRPLRHYTLPATSFSKVNAKS